MPFKLGFNCRNNPTYVTDQSWCVYVPSTDSYPHTYTNVDGYSANGGWTTGGDGGGDSRVNTNDPRIAGYVYELNNDATGRIFRVDLSSGSAPGAGAYNVDIALGLPDQTLVQIGELFDNVTSKIDLTNAGAGYSRAPNHYVDAALANVTATTTWTGTTVPITFASTTVNLKIGHVNQGSVTTLAHFCLELASSGITGAAAITLGALTTVSAGAVAITGAAAPALGALTTSGAGSVAVTGAAAVTLGAVTVVAAGRSGIVGSAAITLAPLTSVAIGKLLIQGIFPEAAETLAALTLVSTGTVAGSTGSAIGSASIPLGPLTVVAVGTVPPPLAAPAHTSRTFTRNRGQIPLGAPRHSFTIPIGPGRRRRRP